MLRRMAILAALAGVLAAPAAAHADAFDDVFADYQKDGRIDACKHSEKDLKAAKGQVPNDIEQYAPDFPAALDEALEDRARTGCKKAAAPAQTTAAAPAPAATPGATPPAPQAQAGAPAPATTVPQPPGAVQAVPAAADGAIVNAAAAEPAKGSDGTPAALVVLGVLGGLLLLGLLAWGLARFFAWDPAWLARTRHAIAEAGWRTSGVWADFSDWLRRGRTTPG